MDVSVVCRVNGARAAARATPATWSSTRSRCVSFISHVMTLLPGDVVATGTPEGVGAIQRGDWVEVEVGGVGVLRNPVV